MGRQIKVTVEARNGEELYQRTTFEQFYNTHELQIQEQLKVFPALAGVVLEAMVKAGEEKLAELGAKAG